MPIAQLASSDGSEKCKTFVIQDEGHTLGNALRAIIITYENVKFCAYSIPHPAEEKIVFRIEVTQGRAVDVFKKGLTDLSNLCDHTIEAFQQSVEDFRNDQVNQESST